MKQARRIIPFLLIILMMAVNISLVQADDTDSAEVVVSDTIEYGTVTTKISDTTVSVSAEADEGYCLLDLWVVMPDGTKKSLQTVRWFTMPDSGTAVVYATFGVKSDEIELEIANTEEFLAFAKKVSEGEAYLNRKVALTGDIDLTDTDFETMGDFAGTFEGQGHKISGISMALFRHLYAGTVENLTTEGSIKYDSSELSIGVISEIATSGSSFINCVNYADLTAVNTDYYIGSMTGDTFNYSRYGTGPVTFVSCINYGNISCSNGGNQTTSGGIAGWVHSGLEVRECGNYGSVSGTYYAGGLFGYSSQNGGDVQISSSVNHGDISTVSYNNYACCSGGMIGCIGSAGSDSLTIEDCYNTGDIYAESQATTQRYTMCSAGIAGLEINPSFCSVPLTLANCYNTGKITRSGALSTAEYQIGELLPDKIAQSGEYNLVVGTEDMESYASVTNCYKAADSFDSSTLGNAYKDDTAGINEGNTPLLLWESDEKSDERYSLTFDISGAETYTLNVYQDSDRTVLVTPETDGSYRVPSGTYWYTVMADGYAMEAGTVKVQNDTIKNIVMESAVKVTFDVTPADAELTVVQGSRQIECTRKESGSCEYWLPAGENYICSAYADGYSSISKEFSVSEEKEITIDLTASDFGNQEKGSYIYGSGNAGQNCTVSTGGTYYIAPDARGTITVSTSEKVTFMGAGTGTESAYENLYIDCTGQKSDIVLQDVYISNDTAVTNMINFEGEGNRLAFSGICVLDNETGATGYAMIHVDEDTELTLTCDADGDGIIDGTAYMYKSEQGAGVGGNQNAANGTITVKNAKMFLKNSKQGAFFGAGANAGTKEPGPITIKDSEISMIAVSRGAAIGGSAGSNGASSGSSVKVVNSLVTINIDYSGSAIGGGGYAEGNDSDGGVLIPVNSSIRTFIDYNAVDPNNNGLDDSSDSLWKYSDADGNTTYISQPGVNGNFGITADIQNEDGEKLYLLELDTSGKKASDEENGIYTIVENGETIYQGTTHKYAFINENLYKADQKTVSLTTSNWTELDDPNLYLYLTGEDHVLYIGGDRYIADFDEESGTFTLSEAGYDGLSGDVNFNNKVNIIDAQIVCDMANGSYQDSENYQIMQLAADVNEDGKADVLDARAIQFYVHTGAFGE